MLIARIGMPNNSRGITFTGLAHSEMWPCAMFAQVNGNLAAGVAEANHEYLLIPERRTVPVLRAVQHGAIEGGLSRPRGEYGSRL